MRRVSWWGPLVGALSVAASPALAQEATLTPEGLEQALACRSSGDAMLSYAGVLFTDHPPSWLTRMHDNGHAGMLGLWSFRLAHPIRAFGQSVAAVSFLNNWVVVELPRAQALEIVAHQGMERAPIAASEQYFHFSGEGKGPMMGAFEPTDDALEQMLSGDHAPRPASKTLFVGCNYVTMSRAEFLDLARQADAMLGRSGEAMKKMLEGGAKD
jgi:hypothetical protein